MRESAPSGQSPIFEMGSQVIIFFRHEMLVLMITRPARSQRARPSFSKRLWDTTARPLCFVSSNKICHCPQHIIASDIAKKKNSQIWPLPQSKIRSLQRNPHLELAITSSSSNCKSLRFTPGKNRPVEVEEPQWNHYSMCSARPVLPSLPGHRWHLGRA